MLMSQKASRGLFGYARHDVKGFAKSMLGLRALVAPSKELLTDLISSAVHFSHIFNSYVSSGKLTRA